MDDPWGSPWAEEPPHPLQKADELESKGSVIPGKELDTNQDSRSPWNDDDGYREWAALPNTDETQGNLQDSPEQAEIIEWDAYAGKESTQGKEYVRPDGSTWFKREISHANVGSLDVGMSQISGRALSPDPWAQEDAALNKKQQSGFATDAIVGVESAKSDTDEDITRNRATVLDNTDENNIRDRSGLNGSIPPSGVGDIPTMKSIVTQYEDRSAAKFAHGDAGAENEEAAQGESLTSRPSTSPSDHSHHDETLVESPRTSFEEVEERSKPEREGSIKVKEMVRLFDGLARDENANESLRLGQIDDPNDESDTPLAAQSEDDFGEFEEGASCAATETVQRENISVSIGIEQLEKAGVDGDSALNASTDYAHIDPADQAEKLREPVSFEPQLSLLSQVVDQTTENNFVHTDSKSIPEIDTIIADSFSSTEERKTWYRISRYGTMRKHNIGDEDSYLRINWKDSEIRAKTLKIVERWIEEDRIGGGVILGGGTRLGSMFGWGQKNKAPMSVAAALASKNKKTAAYPDHIESSKFVKNSDSSPLSAGSSGRRSLEQISASTEGYQAPFPANAPQFTWSTGTPASLTEEVHLPSLSAPTSQNNSGQNLGPSPHSPKVVKDSSLRITRPMIPTLSARKLTPPQSPQSVPGKFTELGREFGQKNLAKSSIKDTEPPVEDDWGEMVLSPALENPTPLLKPTEVETDLGVMGVSSQGPASDSMAISIRSTSDRGAAIRAAIPQPVTEGFVSQEIESHTIKLEPLPSISTKPNPWQTADFSFFENPTVSIPKVSPMSQNSKALARSPVTVKQSHRLSSDQAEQDRVVKSIVQNLPNLSYMLRR